MSIRNSREWYRNAVFYSLDVKTFKDSDGDGMGDLKGLISKLDHLTWLGVDCLWLLPFYPSPLRDNGYDVSDYTNVDPRLGSLDEFDLFIKEATKRKLKVMIDLVINHTSIDHPWFKNARTSLDSRYRHYYVWHKDPDHGKVKVVFDHVEESVWAHTPETDMYYLHRFYKEQPDLNLSHPDVQEEILRIMDFWMDRGVSAFRVDAAHMITDPVEVEKTDYHSMHKLFNKMRDHLEQRSPDGVLLAEANVPPGKLADYFNDGEGDARMHMLFNFVGNKYAMLALARERADALKKGLGLYEPVKAGHWMNFVRHHDELNMEQLSDEERAELFAAFAPQEKMRALNGIRRRLPPMVANDRRRMELMYEIMFSLPGTPLINYGEEIGMGDNLSLKGRYAVRTPMQWDGSTNGGFSSAPKEQLYLPVIGEGEFAHHHLNVEAQLGDPGSFMHFMRDLIARRKAHPILGTSEWNMIATNDDRTIALIYRGRSENVLVVHNFSRDQLTLEIAPGEDLLDPADVISGAPIDLKKIDLLPYGSLWIKLENKL